jgi:hypothetical protein
MKRGTLNAPRSVAMADLTPRDDAGNPMDYERYRARCEREAAEAEELRVERYEAPENPEIVAFRVIDRSGKVRGFIGFELDAMELDLPERTLERVRRAVAAHPSGNLKLA